MSDLDDAANASPGGDAVSWCRHQLQHGEPKQIAGSSSEGLATIVVRALGRGPESELPDVTHRYVRMVHRMLCAVRGEYFREIE